MRGYIDNLQSFQLANIELIYWTVRSSSRKGWDGIKGVDGGYHFIRVHENLVQHPTNNISIVLVQNLQDYVDDASSVGKEYSALGKTYKVSACDNFR